MRVRVSVKVRVRVRVSVRVRVRISVTVKESSLKSTDTSPILISSIMASLIAL